MNYDELEANIEHLKNDKKINADYWILDNLFSKEELRHYLEMRGHD